MLLRVPDDTCTMFAIQQVLLRWSISPTDRHACHVSVVNCRETTWPQVTAARSI